MIKNSTPIANMIAILIGILVVLSIDSRPAVAQSSSFSDSKRIADALEQIASSLRSIDRKLK